jgi:hypothetical protein
LNLYIMSTVAINNIRIFYVLFVNINFTHQEIKIVRIFWNFDMKHLLYKIKKIKYKNYENKNNENYVNNENWYL